MASTPGCWQSCTTILPLLRDGAGMTRSAPALQVAADFSVLLAAEGDPVTLDVSPRTLVARHWPQGRPGPLQLERAIDDVENAIAHAGLRHADRGVLHASASLRQVLPQQFSSAAEFSRDNVEAEFSRLVAASGAAVRDGRLAPDGEAAAALLLLREVMHHLGFQTLRTTG